MYICIWAKCKIKTNNCCYVTVYQCYTCKCVMKNAMMIKVQLRRVKWMLANNLFLGISY